MYLEWIQEFKCPVCQTILYGRGESTCPHVLFVHDGDWNEFTYCAKQYEQLIDNVIDLEKSKGKDEWDEDFLTGTYEALKGVTTLFFTVTAQPMYVPNITIGIDLSL